MEFLKHHYEKLILAVLLLLFIAVMFYVLNIIQDTRRVDDSKLRIPTRSADYQVAVPEKDVTLRPNDYWQESALVWTASTARQPESKYFSDLVAIYPMARCPQCSNIVARDFFKEKKCPICGFLLKTPPDKPKFRQLRKSETDRDGDGISNDDEKKYGMDPDNSDDALYDLDRDGFSNVYELMNGFNPANPMSHPPLWHRLRLVEISRIVLPIKFMVLNDNDSKDPTKWDIQINTPPRRKGKKTDDTRFYRIGDIIKIEKRNYKVVGIKRIIEEAKGVSASAFTHGGDKAKEEEAKRSIDRSEVSLKEELYDRQGEPDELLMVRGQLVYSSDKRPVLEDTGIPGGIVRYTLRVGDTFDMGTRATRITRYQVMSLDEKKMTVLLREPRAKKQPEKPLLVTRSGEIPEDFRVIPGEQKAGGPAGEMERLR